MTCQFCSQPAEHIQVVSEFSATSPTGWRVVSETPVCADHM